jgi:energy-coupling factor transport system ATP-binding protein
MGCSKLMNNLFEFDRVRFSYLLPSGESISAIQDVSFSIQAGEYVAVIGANGSGKTTLVKLMNGLITPDGGSVRVAGISTSNQIQPAEIFTKVGLIFQNPRDQIVASLVEEDTAFGPENLCLAQSEIKERVDASLTMCGASHLKGRQTYLLSAGETQRIALAGVLAMHPACLIFDETTAMLDPRSRKDLIDLMANFHQQGFTIIHVTHDLDEALAAKRILVLHEGHLVMDGTPQEVFKNDRTMREYDLDIPFVLRYARDLQSCFSQLSAFYRSEGDLLNDLMKVKYFNTGAGQSQDLRQAHAAEEDFIHFEHLSHTYMAGTPLAQTALQDITFSLPGVGGAGLVGHTGSGKSTILQHLNGLIRPQQGKVRIGEFDLSRVDVDIKSLRQRVGLVFQSPEAQFFETYVGDEIAYAARMLGYTGKLRDLVRAAMQAVGLDFEQFVDRPLYSLSGGQKRRVALASYLVVQPRVLLLDEPFAGLDPLIHQEMIDFVNRLKDEGKTIVLSTHTMRDLLQMIQKVIVLHNGKMVFDGAVADLFRQPDLNAWGLEIPLELKIADGLRKNGWQIPADAVRWKAMLGWLRRNSAEVGNARF